MKKLYAWFFGLTVFLMLTPSANAYLGPATASNTFDLKSSWDSLFSPFQNFIQSMEGINKTTIDIHQTQAPLPPNYRLDIGKYPIGLDDWVYASTGVRPSTAITSFFAWFKNAVDFVIAKAEGR